MLRKCLALVFALVAATAMAQTTPTTAPATTAPATTAAATTAPGTLPPGVFTAAPTPFVTISQCQACASQGQCSGAYKGLPGKYCGDWLSTGIRQVCCCPTASTCAIPSKKDKCDCIDPAKVKTHSGMPYWVWILIAVGAFILCAAVCYCFCRSAQDEPAVYVQEPMYVNQYGQPVMVNGNYATAGGYGPGYGGGYGDGGLAAGVAVGATAGLVGGLALGAAMDAGHGYGGGGGGGYVDNGATFGGDF